MKNNLIYFLILSSILIFSSCNKNKNEILINKLQGDWIYNNEEDGFISIKDSHLFQWEYSNDFEPFFIKNDTLIAPKYKTRFTISRVTDKYIWIREQKSKEDIPLFLSTNTFYNSNLKIISIEIRFKNFINHGLLDWSIYFNKNMDCFMKIDKVRHRNLDAPLPYSKGIYYHKLTPIEFAYYQNKFRNIPLNRVKKEYVSENYTQERTCYGTSTDVIFCEFEFGYKNSDKIKRLDFIVKGSECLPGYLGVFILHLNKICNTINFNETSRKYEFKFYQNENSF